MTGKPISPEERAKRSNTQLIQGINRSIRSDFGGKVPQEHLGQLLLEQVPELKAETTRNLAILMIDLIRNQVEGIRTRTSHDREELLRRFMRFQGEDPYQSLVERVETLEKQMETVIEMGV